MGCSATLLQKLKRLGWIKPVEPNRLPFHKMHFRKQDLDDLCWDYMFSLSMYDLFLIRMNSDAHPAAIAKHSGIPVRVVELVIHSETPAFIVELIQYHGRWCRPDALKLTTDLTSLAKAVTRISNTHGAIRYRVLTSRAGTSSSWERLSPSRIVSLCASHIYGGRSVAARLGSDESARAWNLNRHLAEDQLPPKEFVTRSGETIAPLYQKELVTELQEIRQRALHTRTSSGKYLPPRVE